MNSIYFFEGMGMKKDIQKRMILLSIILSYLGLIIIIVGLSVLTLFDLVQTFISYLFIGIGIILLISGTFLMCSKCSCPYCGFGKGSRFSDSSYHQLLSYKNIKKGNITCPKCNEHIYII